MPSEILVKLNKLSDKLKAKLSQEDFLAKVDKLEDRYGIKAVLILLDLLLGELDFSDLARLLVDEYDFNQFLADQIKGEFALLIEALSEEAEKEIGRAERKARPEIKAVAETLMKRDQPSFSPSKNVEEYFSKPKAQTAAEPSSSGIVHQALSADAGLIFSASDEAEINKFGAAANAKTVPNYALDAENILSGFKARPQDPDLARRLTNIVVSRIRGLRDDLEIKELLVKETSLGGVGLSAADAEILLKLIRNSKSHLDKSRVEFYPETKTTSSTISQIKTENPLIDLDFGEPEEAIDEEAERSAVESDERVDATAAKNDLRIEMENGLPVVRAPLAEEKLSEEAKNVKIQPAKADSMPSPMPAPFIAKKTIPASVLNAKTAGRPNLDDVKLQRKLSGPIEDLANMTLIEFRRLAENPKAAVEKVDVMIELLGQESFDKKHQGIAAWQKSEVNKFYRLLGQTAMNEGISIEETIKDRLVEGKPTLTLDEFNAVMELNRKLRY